MHTTTAPVSPLAPYGATLLRLALGVLFLVHALIKLLVFTPAGTAAFFESLGLPGVLAYLTIGAELVITTALLLGIYARWVAWPASRCCWAPSSPCTAPTASVSPMPAAAGNTRRSGHWRWWCCSWSATASGPCVRADRRLTLQPEDSMSRLPSLYISHGSPMTALHPARSACAWPSWRATCRRRAPS